ncbi:glycosyltransferase [Roseovarius gahaiensis]|uniref:Glycosyltransferase n=1 Tax=Roseovarius gahaiensis TaxID=2716691 RepID=A0A967EKT0_9RHOB|nr:glycosyltransferase [Roseovarius gahaiensis]NHQ74974.1 glycosyltransferase [Roseovarius gahaiensis]
MYDPAQLKKDAETIRKSGYFDADWYRATYPDVDRLGMDPAEHYLRFGALMRRDPGPEFCTGFYLDSHPGGWQKTTNPLVRFQGKGGGEMAPKHHSVLWAAANLAERGQHARAIALAERYLPEDLAYSAHILRANAALAKGREDDWLAHLNAYLGRFDVAPLVLKGEGSLLDRFSTAPLPPVTGGPLVSVIMPAFNAEGTIRAAARSILGQTWRNLELLIVDDASEDGTWAVMQEIAAGDDRVKIRRNRANVGPYVSKNLALTEAKGDWITGHDADDWAHPQRLEQHLGEVLGSNGAIRASLTYMIRVEPDGRFGRITRITPFAFDGVTRKSSISLLLETDRLRRELGAWDCVRFGADSEMIARVQRVFGESYRELPQIGMICMEFAESLTNHEVYGVSRTTGPSETRIQYKNSWTDWQRAAAPNELRLDFPPSGARPFVAPEEMRVNRRHIALNTAALRPTTTTHEPVTAICVSRRPEFLGHVARMLGAQTHTDLHVIYVAHGPDHDSDAIRAAFAGIGNFKLLILNKPDTFLADGLNLALEACETDLVCKIDDDDHYGPAYVANALRSFRDCDHDNIPLSGKARTYCYVQSRDAFGLRFSRNGSNSTFKRVHGGTLFWSRERTGYQKFERVRQGTDSRFTGALLDKGLKIYSADPYDFVHMRYQDTSAHTWQIADDEFMRPMTTIASGLRLDIAFSTQCPFA